MNTRFNKQKNYCLFSSALCGLSAIMSIVLRIFGNIGDNSAIDTLAFIIFFSIMTGIIFLLMYNFFLKPDYKFKLDLIDNKINSIKTIDKVEKLQDKALKLSYTFLQEYYEQTKIQSNKGFQISISIAIVGAGILFTGIALCFFNIMETAYITLAAGAITEFVATVFFYLYNKSIVV